MNSVELYPHNPYLPLKAGESSLANIPLKKPNPWAAQIQSEYLPAHPGGIDNLSDISAGLQREYPNAVTPSQQFSALTKAYDAPGRYQLLTKNKFPVSQGNIQLKDPTPWNAETKWDTAFVPSQESMKSDPQAASAYSQKRQFGVLAHEMRHINAYWNAPGFKSDPGGNGASQEQDLFGNQYDHFPGGYTDRDMANSLKMLELSHSNEVPDSVRTANPWMGLKGHQPTIDDLMQYIGKQPGYKK